MKTPLNKTLSGFSLRPVAAALLISVALAAPIAQAMVSSDTHWQPVSSEKLIRLPANFMEKTLEQDFRDSPLASSIGTLDGQIRSEGARMHQLKDALQMAEGEDRVELRHQFLAAKSAYLDLMHEKQKLDSRALQTRTRVYERVLQQLRNDQSKASDRVSVKLIANQRAARQRMEQSVARVDEAMSDIMSGRSAQSQNYAEKYANNLAKLESLKFAINRHVANAAAAIDGEEVSREQYVRHLLASIEAERSLLDQSQLMLTYMSKLVALDAQALEHELTTGIDSADFDDPDDVVSLANATELFINQ